MKHHGAQRIYSQFLDPVAQKELRDMSDQNHDWVKRTDLTLQTILPHLPDLAKSIKAEIERKLGFAAALVKLGQSAQELGGKSGAWDRWHSEFNAATNLGVDLINNLASQQISAEVQTIVAKHPLVSQNVTTGTRNSIYPDLVFSFHSYTGLPVQTKKNPIDGPCVKGKSGKPSNVPDGLEIKTNQGNRVRVDAHGPHPGLHIGITWDKVLGAIVINGVWGAYVRIADHRHAERNMEVTTEKYSFGHDIFHSLL